MSNKKTYFHLSPIRVAPDGIIKAGNWGRILKRYQAPGTNVQTFGNAWVLARELQFEMVRASHFPNRPSRLESAFCSLDEVQARIYQGQNDAVGVQSLHEVELVDPTLATHVAPLDMINFPTTGTLFLDQTHARAIAYWTGNDNGAQELVTLSDLRIIRNVG